MIKTRICYIGIIFIACFGSIFSSCTYPWGGGPWKDSLGRTTINFNSSSMQNYDLSFRGSVVSTWTCLFKNGSLILSRSSAINVAGFDYYLYVCMLVSTVSSNKYYYHLMLDTHSSIIKPGTSVGVRATAKRTTVNVTGLCTVCTQTTTSVSPSVTEFIVMTVNGNVTLVTTPSFAPNPCDLTTTTQVPTTTTTITTTTSQNPANPGTTSQGSGTATETSTSTERTSVNLGAVIGPTIGILVLIFLISMIVIWLTKKKNDCSRIGQGGISPDESVDGKNTRWS